MKNSVSSFLIYMIMVHVLSVRK